MSGGINLTSAMRSNLLTLQGTQNLIGATQNRLATGLKVSSAIDDPRNFFQAQALNNRASDLNRRLDGMGLAIKTFEAADKGIKAMTKIVENMSAIVKEARDASGDDADDTRSDLREQYESLRTQLQDIAKDSGFNGINLLAGDELAVAFNESGESKLEVEGVDYTVDGALGLTAQSAEAAWDTAETDPLIAVEAALNSAISSLRTQAATLGSDLTLVRIREDFTKDMVNTLKAGADGLVLADQNEEAANLLALQTRQQLGIQALSLAAQSQQGILRLF
jgi:flagellin